MSYHVSKVARWTRLDHVCARIRYLDSHSSLCTSPSSWRYIPATRASAGSQCHSLHSRGVTTAANVHGGQAIADGSQPHKTHPVTTQAKPSHWITTFPSSSIRLGELPISPKFVAHSGRYPTLPLVFASKFAAIHRAWTRSKTLAAPREDPSFARDIREAELVCKSFDVDSLVNWLSSLSNSAKRVNTLVSLLAGSVLTSAHQILHVLAKLKPLKLDFEIRIICLYLTGYFYKAELLGDAALLRKFDGELDKLRHPSKWPEAGLNANHLRLLLWRSTDDQLSTLLDSVSNKYHPPSALNIQIISSLCAGKNRPDDAFSFLQKLSPQELEDPSPKTLACCCQLIDHDTVVETGRGHNFRYLSELLVLGLKPGGILYDRIIGRALELGYPSVALDVFRYALSIDTSLGPRTFYLMLRQAFLSQEFTLLDEIMSHVKKNEELYGNPYVLMYALNIVRRINHAQERMTPADGLVHILALYDRVYSRAPLVKLGLASKIESRRAIVDKAKPDSYMLAFTVWAYILCHKTGQIPDRLWHRIVRLIKEADQTVLACMRHELIYNAFIFLYVKEQRTLSNALEVFQYMLQQQLCAPTSRTWTILICGFLRQKQDQQAKQIYDLMLQHGFTIHHIRGEFLPNGVTLQAFATHMDAVLDEKNLLDDAELEKRAEGSNLQVLAKQEIEYSPFGELVKSNPRPQGVDSHVEARPAQSPPP